MSVNMSSLELAAQLPGPSYGLSNFSDPFRRKGVFFWTKLQKVPTVCDMVSKESLFLEGKLSLHRKSPGSHQALPRVVAAP